MYDTLRFAHIVKINGLCDKKYLCGIARPGKTALGRSLLLLRTYVQSVNRTVYLNLRIEVDKLVFPDGYNG